MVLKGGWSVRPQAELAMGRYVKSAMVSPYRMITEVKLLPKVCLPKGLH